MKRTVSEIRHSIMIKEDVDIRQEIVDLIDTMNDKIFILQEQIDKLKRRLSISRINAQI